jgi:hypothetical protein
VLALQTLPASSEDPSPPALPRILSTPISPTPPASTPKDATSPGAPAGSPSPASLPAPAPATAGGRPVPETRAASPASPTSAVTRTVIVPDDGTTTLQLSASSLNRLLLPDLITSAYTSSEALDTSLEGKAAIVTFRAARAADLLVVTATAQYLLRLVPADLPAQTIRLRQPRPQPHLVSSYQTQLTTLIEAAYRRQPPPGFHTDRPGLVLPAEGALQWVLTLQHRGRTLSVQEYALYNTGALPHPTDPATLAARFPTARAVSADPLALAPGAWGRVLVIVDTDTLSENGDTP